jgi:AcrR family transcriptional regulator
VAKTAEVPLDTFYRNWPERGDLLAAVARTADAEVLADGPAGEAEPLRDRIFDILMRRFEALQPFRPGLRAVVRELPFEPLTAAAFLRVFVRSMSWMLRAAGIPAETGFDRLRIGGVGALYLATFRVWLDDDSPDLAKTMAALDRLLHRLEDWRTTLRSCCGARSDPSPEAPSGQP